MKVVAIIEPPEAEVFEKILRHCGLWQESACRAPPDVDGLVKGLELCCSDRQAWPIEPDRTQELTYVDIDTFLATFQ